MKTMEWTFRNKSENSKRFRLVDEWGPGPWDSEPDKVQWQDPTTGLPCLALRNKYGAWCGYVGLPAGHPWRSGDHDSLPVDVHGGLTFGPSACDENEPETGICHVVDDPSEDDVRWIGFDCHHYLDASPGMMASDRNLAARDPEYAELMAKAPERGTYRTIAYAKNETTNLARQCAWAMIQTAVSFQSDGQEDR